MFGFTIPNTPDSGVVNQNQAEPDSLDFFVVGNNKTGVVSGMLVTAGSGDIVNIASGEVLLNGTYYQYGGGTSSLTTYTTAAFFDVVVARVNTGTGVVTPTIVAGTTSNPRFPSVGTSGGQINPNTDVVLATVWRDGTVVDTNRIVDKRSFIPSSLNRVQTTPTGGNHADLSVRSTSWTPDATLAGPISVKVGSTWYQLARYSANFTAGTVTASSFVGPLTGNVTGNLTGTASYATSAGSVAWGNITGIPALVYNNGGSYSINVTYATSAGSASSASYADTAGFMNVSVNADTRGGPYIGWSTNFGGWSVEGGFRITNTNFYLTGLGTTGSAANLRVLGDGRVAQFTSRRSVKDDIEDISYALSTINSLRPRTFNLKPQETDTEVERFVRANVPNHGFIVEEIEEDAPQLLDYTLKDNVVTAISWKTTDLIAVLTKAVQELSTKVDALEAQVG